MSELDPGMLASKTQDAAGSSVSDVSSTSSELNDIEIDLLEEMFVTSLAPNAT
jgi:hypothetical protein